MQKRIQPYASTNPKIACSPNPTPSLLRYFILGVKLSLIAYNNATLDRGTGKIHINPSREIFSLVLLPTTTREREINLEQLSGT